MWYLLSLSNLLPQLSFILLLPLVAGRSVSVVSFLLGLMASIHMDLSLATAMWIPFFLKSAFTASLRLNLGCPRRMGLPHWFSISYMSCMSKLFFSSWSILNVLYFQTLQQSVGCCWDNLIPLIQLNNGMVTSYYMVQSLLTKDIPKSVNISNNSWHPSRANTRSDSLSPTFRLSNKLSKTAEFLGQFQVLHHQ